jgi:hypothetical protein
MDEQDRGNARDDEPADELLRRALLEPEAAAAVALKVNGLALAEQLTVVFHGRRDLGTVQTYVANGGHGEGETLGARDLLRVPCDLDLADADTRREAEEAYAAQARTLRDALQAADTVLAVWQDPVGDFAEGDVAVVRSVDLDVQVPAHRIMPVALVAPDRGLVVRSRTSPMSTRSPTIPRHAWRTSWSGRRSMRVAWPSAWTARNARCSASSSSTGATASTTPPDAGVGSRRCAAAGSSWPSR